MMMEEIHNNVIEVLENKDKRMLPANSIKNESRIMDLLDIHAAIPMLMTRLIVQDAETADMMLAASYLLMHELMVWKNSGKNPNVVISTPQ